MMAENRKPLISVVIPAYNSREFIEKTVESVLAQSWSPFELLVIDDASTDGTPDLLRERFGEDSRFQLLENEKNLGMVGNWNRCVKEAHGEFVKLLCADDVLLPEALEKEVQPMLFDPEINLVCSDTILINSQDEVTGRFNRLGNGKQDGKKVAKTSILWNDFFGAPLNNLFRKSAWEKVGGFDAGFPYILDFDCWMSIAELGAVYMLREPLNRFRIRSGSNTDKAMGSGEKGNSYIAEHARLVEKHRAPLQMSPFACSFSVWWRGTRNHLIHIYLKLCSLGFKIGGQEGK